LEPVIGIDLGTTNSVVATVRDGRVEVIPDGYGNRLHPSVVAFVQTGDVVVGHAARARRHVDPINTIYSAKRLMGQSIRDPVVGLAISSLPYQVEEGPNEQPVVVVRGRRYTIPEISSFVLMHLKQCAEKYLHTTVSKAVITVPANFTDSQRQATKYAGELADLEVLRILNEPTAAALAYGFGKAMDAKLAIYDLGGGTFDVTVLEIHGKIFEVLATGGDAFLGGDDFDRAVLHRLSGEFLMQQRIDLREFPEGYAKLLSASEQIKCRLSTEDAVAGTIHDLAVGAGGFQLGLEFELTRPQFELLVEPYVKRSVETCAEVLNAVGLTAAELTDVILVGGSTRTPMVRELIEQQFGRAPRARINPDETVAYGAALHANGLTVADETPGQDFYSLLLDVAPRALGIAVAGGYNEIIIERNTPIPVERTRNFITSKDGQTQVNIEVCQGEARSFSENEKLGVLSLQGIPARKRGESAIEVTFTIDTDGILSVRARDAKTNTETQATMKVVGAPTAEDKRALADRQQPFINSDDLPSPA